MIHRTQRLSMITLCSILVLLSLPTTVLAGEARAVFYHVHTIYSLDNPGWELFKPSVGEVIERADRVVSDMGMEGGVTITDHRTIDACFDPEFVPVGAACPIKGEEWGGGGHAGVLNFTGDTPITEYSGPDRYVELVTEAHERGGIVIANHPRPESWKADRRLGLDGIEIWSTSFWDPLDELAKAWWQRLLVAGEQITAVGASDSHFRFLPIETPVNLVWSESNEPDDLVEGMRQGHLVISASPMMPRVFLAADTDGNGVYDDAIVGDAIMITHDTTIEFQTTVECGEPSLALLLVDSQGTFYTGGVGSDPGWSGDTFRFSHSFSAASRDFVRAELRADFSYPLCITNPVYAVGIDASVETEGGLQGTVTDAATGSLLQGAFVEMKPGAFSTDTTDGDGAFAIIVPNGTYSVVAKMEGYFPHVRTGISITGETICQNFALSPMSCGTVPVETRRPTMPGLACLSFILPLGIVLIRIRGLRDRTTPRVGASKVG